MNTYPSFTDSHTLFNKLMERYQPPPNFVSSDENLVNITKKRVATLMLQWVTRDVDLLDTILIQKITNFAEVKLPQDKLESIGQRICQQLKKAESAKNSSSNYKPPEIIIYNLPQISVSKLFFSAHPVDIAEQLTLLDLEIFSRIELSELIGQRWVKESTQILSSNVVQLICKVNRLAFWVGTMILLQVKVADRVDAIKFFVSVAQNLFQKNNFNSLLGILAGLNLASITRLQITLNNLPKKTTELMEYLFTIQDPSSSFKHLREAKKKAGFNAVPYLGLNLQDLTRIDEGNATELIVSGLNLINFPKFSLNETATSDLLIHQKAIDNFKISKLEPLFTFLGELPALTEKELHSMSLEREPKGCTAKDVI
uniref:Ras-GEF domain-containing protein n=1 Tax=Arcella intermedia TaxID=1963864 RepID=A0A6B2L6A9_9EUKA